MSNFQNIYPFEEFNVSSSSSSSTQSISPSSSSSSSSSSCTSGKYCNCTKTCIGSCCPTQTFTPKCCTFTAEDLTNCIIKFEYIPGQCPGGNHQCDRAVFEAILNNVSIGEINLNNAIDGKKRSTEYTIEEFQAKKIVAANPCSLRLKLNCRVPGGCHDGIVYVTLTLPEGKTIKCKNPQGEEIDYGPEFFKECVKPTGIVALTDCLPQNCIYNKCNRKYDKIFSPVHPYRYTFVGRRSDVGIPAYIAPLRFWGDLKYESNLIETCKSTCIPFPINLPQDFCYPQYSNMCSTSSIVCGSTALYPPHHVSFGEDRIAVTPSLTYDTIGNITPDGYIENDQCVYFSEVLFRGGGYPPRYSYISLSRYDTNINGQPRILYIRNDYLNDIFVLINQADNDKYLDIYSTDWQDPIDPIPNDILWARTIQTSYLNTAGVKPIQADFTNTKKYRGFRVVLYDNGQIIINTTHPDSSDARPDIGIDWNNPSTPPTWRDKRYKYIFENAEQIVTIQTDGKIDLWGHDLNNYTITQMLSYINSNFTNIVKILFMPFDIDDGILFCLTDSGDLVVFGEDDEGRLTDYGISPKIDRPYANTPWEKVNIGEFYYFRLKDRTIKLKDFSITGSYNGEGKNLSIVGIISSNDTDQNEGETWCYCRSFYAGTAQQIGYFGEANCCHTAGRRSTSSSSA
jgi:hypothetical protein